MSTSQTDPPDAEAESTAPVIMVRGEPVMLATRVAQVFEVATREVVQAVKRNPLKFPETHAFELTRDEVESLTSHAVISNPRPRRQPRFAMGLHP